jgi:hypothetical protein
MKDSLLARAGLDIRSAGRERSSSGRRYDPSNNAKGQIKLPDQAL